MKKFEERIDVFKEVQLAVIYVSAGVHPVVNSLAAGVLVAAAVAALVADVPVVLEDGGCGEVEGWPNRSVAPQNVS